MEIEMDPAAMLADRPWRPLSLHPLPPPWRPQPASTLLLLAIIAMHFLAARWLWLQMGRTEAAEIITVLEFPPVRPRIAPPPLPQPVVTPPRPHAPRKVTPRKHVTHSRTLQVNPIAAEPLPAPSKTARNPPRAEQDIQQPPPTALQLYDDNGRLRVPADMLDQIDRRYGDKRVFSYQIPHMDDAKKYFDRNQVLSFQSTRFEEFYKPDRDMLTELLQKLVEKSTRQIRIPVPGKPGSTMVCTVSLLALGGGCGIQRNGSHYVGAVDDPDTLSPEEDRQCQGWWQQIMDARTQDAWRQTRKLYERECRKPMARESSG